MKRWLCPMELIRNLELHTGHIVRCVGTAKLLGPVARCVLVECGPQSHLSDPAGGVLLKMPGASARLERTGYVTIGGPATIGRVLAEGTVCRSPVSRFAACLENLTELSILDDEDRVLKTFDIATLGAVPPAILQSIEETYADNPEARARKLAAAQEEFSAW